ncbi:MAG TPA: grasp-with-spasm system ATP-grasp peptide maturase [Porphyromonadaceae bacterium]|jgi:ATP-GRASP peptide maturase of grasp-with-spasm system|nr:grasp-with-spasm system ATP-grasp peptide maturase [Porphyromonadaceae bacterium]HBX20646.1 grasp-with-spasm system ATP-grasp peptide maturase [Porphyromonadaceae bacterium]
MILIISQNSDLATTQVISWLTYFKKEFIRLNGDENYRIQEVTEDKLMVEKNGKIINLVECDSYWYRRNGIFNLHLGSNPIKLSNDKNIPRCFIPPINSEFEVLRNHIYRKLENQVNCKKRMGSYFIRSVNKLDVINHAKSVGLKVPFTAIVSTKENLTYVIKEKKAITKAASESIYNSEKNRFYTSYTSRISSASQEEIPEIFMASFIQEEIKKKYEIRIFYLKGKTYSSVIFSQNNEDGMIDCRRALDFRYLPYKLPTEIRVKINKLMKKLQLNTGSIDMIVDQNNQYIFLEVNPVGQFVAYGEFCNYYLDRELAKTL